MTKDDVVALVKRTAIELSDDYGYSKNSIPASAIMEHLPRTLSPEDYTIAQVQAEKWENQPIVHHVMIDEHTKLPLCGAGIFSKDEPVKHMLHSRPMRGDPFSTPLCEACDKKYLG